jgi:hypothetical protein
MTEKICKCGHSEKLHDKDICQGQCMHEFPPDEIPYENTVNPGFCDCEEYKDKTQL